MISNTYNFFAKNKKILPLIYDTDFIYEMPNDFVLCLFRCYNYIYVYAYSTNR